MDVERRPSSHRRLVHTVSKRWCCVALSIGLLAAGCVQDATDVADTVAEEPQTVTTASEAEVATHASAGDEATTTSTMPPLWRVTLEQVVGGSLLEPPRSENGSIEPPAESSHMNAVAAGPAGLVAVGESSEATTGNLDAVVWTSPDGREWTRVVDEPGVFGDAASLFTTSLSRS